MCIHHRTSGPTPAHRRDEPRVHRHVPQGQLHGPMTLIVGGTATVAVDGRSTALMVPASPSLRVIVSTPATDCQRVSELYSSTPTFGVLPGPLRPPLGHGINWYGPVPL